MRVNRFFKRETISAVFFLSPNFIGFLSFTLLPVVFAFVLSFFRCDLLRASNILSWEFVGFENFVNLLGFHRADGIIRANDPQFWRFLWNTIFLMAKIPFVIALSLGLALLLNKPIRGRVFFGTVYFLPTICTGTAMYMLWRWMFNPDFGLLNQFIYKTTNEMFAGPRWLSSTLWAKPAFILMNIWAEMGGLNTLLYLAALQTIPKDYYEASELDGAGAWQRFKNITVPMLGPATFFILIINLINGFQEGFQQAHIMTQGGPAGSTTMLGYYIYNHAYVWNNMGYAAAISLVLFLIVLSITALSWKFGNKVVYYK